MKRWLSLALLLSVSSTVAPSAEEPRNRKEVDQAIERGLEFLRRTQETDGAWRIGGSRDAAATSLAVMAFLSAGHVPGEGKYGDSVERGIQWVLKQQKVNGLIATQFGNYEMYHHGIATLMLAEAAGMTEGKLSEEIREKLQKAVLLILDAQRKQGPHKGGWRYHINGTDGDMSVTGWQLMALRASKNLGCDVPAETVERAIEFVKSCQDPTTGGFHYSPRARLTIPCTGTGILALELCGKEHHRSPAVLKAAAYLRKNPPEWGRGGHFFFYEIYYCSQAMFQVGGNDWNAFRPHLHQMLLRSQQTNGSWTLNDGLGPNYGTAMSILALTVEYRYLPIYQRGEEPTDKKE